MAFIAEKIKDFRLDDEDMDYCQFVVAVVLRKNHICTHGKAFVHILLGK